MAQVFYVVENGVPFLYYCGNNKRLKKKKYRFLDSTLDKFLEENGIERLEENSEEHKFFMHEFIDSKSFEKNFLEQLSNPLDNNEFCVKLLKSIHKNNKCNIREFKLSTTKMGKVKDISDLQKFKIMSKTFMKLYSNIPRLFQNINRERLEKIFKNEKIFLTLIKFLCKYNYTTFLAEGGAKLGINEDEYETLQNIINGYVHYESDHIGFDVFQNENNFDYKHGFTKGPTASYKIRIYLNCKNKEILNEFLNEYISFCLGMKLNYDMKGDDKPISYLGLDTTILYCNPNDLIQRIRILEKIAENHPEWINEFGEPPLGCSRCGSGFYGICQAGAMYKSGGCAQTFNDMFDQYALISYYHVIACIFNDNNWKFKDPKLQKILMTYLNLNNIGYYNNTNYPTSVENISIDTIKEQLSNFFLKRPDVRNKVESYLGNYGEEFKTAMLKLHNVAQNNNDNTYKNIAISKEMTEYFEYLNNQIKQISSSKLPFSTQSENYVSLEEKGKEL